MAKTKLDKIANIEEEMKQLAAERSKLLQQHKAQEKAARTNRLCKRGGFLESLLPDTVPLSDEQFQTFLKKTLATEHSRRILDSMTAQNAAAAAQPTAGTAAQGTTPPADKQRRTAQNSGTGGNGNNGETARVGFYQEILFPRLDVRLIAIHDNIDSDEGESDLALFHTTTYAA